ncbi:Blue-light-activated protein [Roseivivax sp. THAF30]|nr:Blue-light-activated protein [Roseivivax sp. THAF30]
MVGSGRALSHRDTWLLLAAASLIVAGSALALTTAAMPAPFWLWAPAIPALLLWIYRHRGALSPEARLAAFIAEDPVACLLSDKRGRIVLANRAARETMAAIPEIPVRDVIAVAAGPFDIDTMIAAADANGRDVARLDAQDASYIVSARVIGPRLLWRFDPLPMSNTSVPILSVGRRGAILSMNRAARDLIGQRPRKTGQLVADPPIDVDRIYRIKTRDGPRDMQVSILNEAPGRREIALLEIEEASSISADRSENVPVAMLKLRQDGTIISATEAASALLGHDDVDDTPLARYMEGLGRAIPDWLAEAAKNAGVPKAEFLRLTREDREAFVQVTLSRVVEDRRTILIAVMHDATEFKSLEAQFNQSQKMQAIGELAGGIAHDFNNVLTAISGHCELMLMRHDPGDPDYADLVQIDENTNRAAGLVGQLLAFSRKQTLRPTMLDLRELLADLAHLLNRLVGENLQLILSHDPLLPPVRGDRRKLEQVIMNLVVNARDAMEADGDIVVSTEDLYLEAPLRRDGATVPEGRYAVIRVSDRGCGIAEDKLGKIFEPFYTTKSLGKGTGLGLSTAYGIVKQTGGFIFADSEEGMGTTFTLYLPAFEGEHAEIVEPDPLQTSKFAQPAGGVILLVEDEAPVRAFASRALTLSGYTVIEAEHAAAALELLQDPSFMVDLVVSDVLMPGLDGPTWIEKARETRPTLPVVFVSGYAEDALHRASGALENSAFLQKPFSLKALAESVAVMLADRRAG